MIIEYEPAPLPGKWCYLTRARWDADLGDYLVITLYDPEKLAGLVADPETAHIPGEMCQATQNLPTSPRGTRLRLVS